MTSPHVLITFTCKHCHNASTQRLSIDDIERHAKQYYDHHRSCEQGAVYAGVTFEQALARACEGQPTLVEALSFIAMWENDRAVHQALKGESDVDGKLWDTCFLYCFQQVFEKFGGTAATRYARPTAEPEGPRGSDDNTLEGPGITYRQIVPESAAALTDRLIEQSGGAPLSPHPPLTDLQEARRLLRSWVTRKDPAELHDAICCVVHHLENLGK